MRVVVTGGAGFIGSHLCDALLARGDAAVCVDNLATGRVENISNLLGEPAFEFIEADVSGAMHVRGPIHAVAHLASPASPPHYLRLALETLAVGSRGTENALRLAESHQARFVLASTSEVYGDPTVHPQPEEYWGHVNPIGPRSVYDEAKRFAEALTSAYRRTRDVNTGIIRIFNTYGPRMSATDGRIVTNFVRQALTSAPLTIYGDGTQTRSFCYIDDLVRGILRMIDSSEEGPVNLGNPEELSVAEFAHLVLRATGSSSKIEYRPLPADDPTRRRPAIGRARQALAWEPEIAAEEGLRRTIDWFLSRPHELNTRDLGFVGFDEAVTWDFVAVWMREGLLVRVWVSSPYPFAGALVFSTLPDVAVASRTSVSLDAGTPAGTVVFRAADLASAAPCSARSWGPAGPGSRPC